MDLENPPKCTPNYQPSLVKLYAQSDLLSYLAYGIGFRDGVYRQKAVDLLHVAKGDHVVEIGCGTGRNFALLERAVGASGKITAVDISAEMLGLAQSRAADKAWPNIEFVQADAANYEFPQLLDGAIFTYSLVIIPEYDRVIEAVLRTLRPGRRCVVLDQKLPSGFASRLVPLLNFLSQPLAYSRILSERHIPESIESHAGNVQIEEFYFGFVYIAVGEKTIGF